MRDMASWVRSLGGRQVLGSHGSGCVHSEIKIMFKIDNLEVQCIHRIYYAIISEIINFNLTLL